MTERESNGSGAGTATDAVSAFGAALIKAAEAKPDGTADPRVSAAFALGWHMSELYEQHLPEQDRKPPDLPGLGSLSERQRIGILVDQVAVGVNGLSDPVTRSGLDAIDITALKGLRRAQPSEDPVLQTHVELLDELTAVDFRFGKAYGLGRALADSCREPSDLASLKDELDPYRIANLLRWLDDLETVFPPHAASSVKKSLERWRDALHPSAPTTSSAETRGFERVVEWWRKSSGREVVAPPAVDAASTVGALRRQGELWRALLSGEKQGEDMLEIDNYLDAAKEFVSRARGVVWRVVSKMPILSLLIGVLLGGGVALLVLGSTTQLVGGVTSILAAVGLTWKGLGGALGQLVGKLERPLWGAVLDGAIADSITLLPDNSAERGGRRQVALTITSARSNTNR